MATLQAVFAFLVEYWFWVLWLVCLIQFVQLRRLRRQLKLWKRWYQALMQQTQPYYQPQQYRQW